MESFNSAVIIPLLTELDDFIDIEVFKNIDLFQSFPSLVNSLKDVLHHD